MPSELSRIYVKAKVPDPRGEARKKQWNSLGLGGKITKVQVVDCYTIDARASGAFLNRVAGLLTNPVLESASLNAFGRLAKYDRSIEVGFLPGVTDNVGNTAQEILGKKVYFSQVFFISGKLSGEDIRLIADGVHNPLIQRVSIGGTLPPPRVRMHEKAEAVEVNLSVSDAELKKIGTLGIQNADGSRRGPLALDLRNMKAIRAHFKKLGRKPTDVELEALAQTWSEHCKHTIFADPLDNIKEGLFKKYIRGATEKIRAAKGKKDFCLSVFADNSGGIAFDRDFLITHKVETHNAPSALDPFGGAITDIVGVNRDTLGFGLGAKPVINTYAFCFADPRDESVLYRDEALSQKMLSARRIMLGVIAGINAGGNQSGIPTPQGALYFDKSFRGRPLVFGGTVGLIPKKSGGRLLYEKKARPGDLIVMIGGRVGADGIHGATFASVAVDKASPASAVQIGDPITQKKLSDALIREARDKNLYNSITDNGAGGLSSSVAEMAKESGGCEVELDKAPLKYPGLAPWQIWVSESQERMTLAVPNAKWQKFSAVMRKHGVEATIIGKFTDSGKCIVRWKGKAVLDISMDFLHNGRPVRQQKSTPPKKKNSSPNIGEERRGISDLNKEILELLKRPNIASAAFVSEQYDHEVQAGSVTKPLQGRGRVLAEATVTRPLLTSKRGVVLAQSAYPWYSRIDPYDMAAASLDGAVRAAVAAGADPDHLALLDNFCWSRSKDPERLWQLKKACEACYDLATAYGTPFISGKDSMFNDFHGFDDNGKKINISALPTLLISAIGVIPDIQNAVTLDAKLPGDIVYLLGETRDELGGSEYTEMIGISRRQTPRVDAPQNLKIYKFFAESLRRGLVASAVSVGRGGFAVALCKTAMGGLLGLDVKMPAGGPVTALFSESQGRILVTVDPRKAKAFEKIMAGNSIYKIGKVTAEPVIKIGDIKVSAAAALKAYCSTFKGY